MLPLPGFALALSANHELFRCCVLGSLLAGLTLSVLWGFTHGGVWSSGELGDPDTKFRMHVKSSTPSVSGALEGVSERLGC